MGRYLDISPSVIRNWKRFAEAGATTAVQASEDVLRASQLREAYAKIRELERALGRKTAEHAEAVALDESPDEALLPEQEMRLPAQTLQRLRAPRPPARWGGLFDLVER